MANQQPERTSTNPKVGGNQEADRRYRKAVKKHLEQEDVEREARDAKEALDDPRESRELEKAERKGKRPARH